MSTSDSMFVSQPLPLDFQQKRKKKWFTPPDPRIAGLMSSLLGHGQKLGGLVCMLQIAQQLEFEKRGTKRLQSKPNCQLEKLWELFIVLRLSLFDILKKI